MAIVVDPKLIKYFKTAPDFRDWLSKNYTKEDGIWLKLYRKNSGVESVNYDQALGEALCFGWIDGQVKKLDEEISYVQRFTPRRKRSTWSKRNIEHTKRLIAEKRMMPSGQSEIDRAKADGRWDKAY